MKKVRFLFAAIVSFTGIVYSASAIQIASGNIKKAWGYTPNNTIVTSGSAGEFIVDGDLSKGSRGTWSDEGAIVAVIGTQINEHGGYFCPYQLQCANKKKNTTVWFEYYQAAGYSSDKCAWLCERGYSGPNCEKQYYVDNATDGVDVIKKLSKGVHRHTSGEDDLIRRENNVTGFNEYYWLNRTNNKDKAEQNVILGIVRFLENGVIAAPVLVGCDWDSWNGVVSWVTRVGTMSNTRKLLCKQGFQPNEDNTDCILANQAMLESTNPVFCGNFPESDFDIKLHRLHKSNISNCYIYVCKDPDKAFPEAGKTNECVECMSDVRGGPSPKDGTCVVCSKLGEYFDIASGDCKPAQGFTHNDLQFGKGKLKGDFKNNLTDQCWTMASPQDYKECVYGTKESGSQRQE